jgi:hypothetical protein
MKVFIDVWKRPEHLLAVQPDIPMVILAGTAGLTPVHTSAQPKPFW